MTQGTTQRGRAKVARRADRRQGVRRAGRGAGEGRRDTPGREAEVAAAASRVDALADRGRRADADNADAARQSVDLPVRARLTGGATGPQPNTSGTILAGYICVLRSNGDDGDRIPLDATAATTVTFGRAPTSDVRIALATCSRQHAELRVDQNARVSLVNHGKFANTTLLNGQPLAPKATRDVRDGDIFEICGRRFKYEAPVLAATTTRGSITASSVDKAPPAPTTGGSSRAAARPPLQQLSPSTRSPAGADAAARTSPPLDASDEASTVNAAAASTTTRRAAQTGGAPPPRTTSAPARTEGTGAPPPLVAPAAAATRGTPAAARATPRRAPPRAAKAKRDRSPSPDRMPDDDDFFSDESDDDDEFSLENDDDLSGKLPPTKRHAGTDDDRAPRKTQSSSKSDEARPRSKAEAQARRTEQTKTAQAAVITHPTAVADVVERILRLDASSLRQLDVGAARVASQHLICAWLRDEFESAASAQDVRLASRAVRLSKMVVRGDSVRAGTDFAATALQLSSLRAFAEKQVDQACALAKRHPSERVLVTLPYGYGSRLNVGNYARSDAAPLDYPLDQKPENLEIGDAFKLSYGSYCSTHARQVLDMAQIHGRLRSEFASRSAVLEAFAEPYRRRSSWVDMHAAWVTSKAEVSSSGVESPNTADRGRAEHDFFTEAPRLFEAYDVVDVYGLDQIDACERFLAASSETCTVDVSSAYEKVGEVLCAMTGDPMPEPIYKSVALLVFTPRGDFLLRCHYHPCASEYNALSERWLANEIDALFLLGVRDWIMGSQASPIRWLPGRSSCGSPLAVFKTYIEDFPRGAGESSVAYATRLLDAATTEAPLPKDLERACCSTLNRSAVAHGVATPSSSPRAERGRTSRMDRLAHRSMPAQAKKGRLVFSQEHKDGISKVARCVLTAPST